MFDIPGLRTDGTNFKIWSELSD